MEERFVKASELLEKEDFLAKLKEVDNDPDVQKLFAENGVDLSLEDIDLMCKQAIIKNAKDELSEEDMDNVAGGIVLTLGTVACFTLASAELGFFTGYAYRKFIKKK